MHTATDPFKNSSSPYPRDLRGNSAAGAGAGKIYPVSPEAVANFKKCLQAQKQATAVPATKRDAKGVTQMDQTKETAVPVIDREPTTQTVEEVPPIDLAATYPASVIKAAQIENAKDGRRDLRSVITADVLAIWHQWNAEAGKTMDWIAQSNGLLQLNSSQVSKFLRKYRDELEQTIEQIQTIPELATPPATAVTAEPEPLAEETAVAEKVNPLEGVEDVEPETEETAVAAYVPEKPKNLPAFLDRDYAPARPRPGDALSTLVQLLNDEQVKVRGSVRLNLEIEFGE